MKNVTLGVILVACGLIFALIVSRSLSPAPSRVEVLEGDFGPLAMGGGTPVLVDFSATWCGPCQRLKPVLRQLSSQYGDSLAIIEIDVDQRPELATRYGASAIPYLVLIQDGQVLDTMRGVPPSPLQTITNWINQKTH